MVESARGASGDVLIVGGAWGDEAAWDFRDDLLYSFEIAVSPTDNTNGTNIYIDDIVFSGP